MISSSALFDLIHSLSPSEKRHFKLFSAKRSDDTKNKYETLFDLIENQEKYNEAEIKKNIQDEKVAGYYAAAKNYLYDVVKDSLFAYHLNLSKESILKKELQVISLLYQKGLFSQCDKLIRKIEKETRSEENFIYLHEALVWKVRLKRSTPKRVNYKTFLTMTDEIGEALEKAKNKVDYSRLMSLFSYLIYKPNNLKNPEIRKKINSFIDDPLLSSEKKATTKTSKIIFNYIHQQYQFFVLKNEKRAFEYGRVNVQIFESAPELIRDIPMNYVRSVDNIIPIGLNLYLYDECRELVEKMKSIIKKYSIKLDPYASMGVFMLHSRVVTTVFIEKSEFEKIELIIDEIEKNLLIHSEKIKITDRILLLFNISYLYFGAGQYKKSLVWIQRLMNDQNDEVQWDPIVAGKILSLIIYIELGDTELLAYSARSVYRFLKKRKYIFTSETIFFKLVNKLIKNKTTGSLNFIYRETKNEFEKAGRENRSEAFKKFDFPSWLESKITNKAFSEIVKAKKRLHNK
jgi:hypothetical protein